VLELGTCVGISGAYMASATQGPTLVTLDASEDLAAIAAVTLGHVTDRAEVVVGRFDETLTATLSTNDFDCAFVDGHHDGDATERYVNEVWRALPPRATIVVDDVRLHRDMWSAWQRLAKSPHVSVSIDVGRFGLLHRSGGDSGTKHFDLSRYAGGWSRVRRRSLARRGDSGLGEIQESDVIASASRPRR